MISSTTGERKKAQEIWKQIIVQTRYKPLFEFVARNVVKASLPPSQTDVLWFEKLNL
jgi:hypothetical protein